jgi:hypothetical protein
MFEKSVFMFPKITLFMLVTFSHTVRNISVQSSVDMFFGMNSCNDLLFIKYYWSSHLWVILQELLALLEMPEAPVHCIPTTGRIPTGFPDHVSL